MYKWMSVFAFVSMAAHAQAVNLPEGTEALQSVAGGVVSTSALCPEGTVCVTNGTIMNLVVNGAGCLDDLLDPTVTVIDSQNVAVHMQLAINAKSKVARCTSRPMYMPTLNVINMYRPFRIHFVGTNQVVEVR